MTTPKVSTVKRGGARFYVDPSSGDKVPGVTSVLNQLPKPFLQYWAAKVVAETAVDNLGGWVNLAMNGDRDGAIDYLKRAPGRNTGRAADMGTEAHDIMERMARGEGPGRVAPDMRWAVDNFSEFLDAFQPEFLHLEETVWSESPGYAGSFDAIAKVGDETLILDWKTTRSGVHAEVALQMCAYANADYIMAPDGEHMPLPAIDGAAVFHTRPDGEGWKVVPAAIDADILLPIFHALLATMQWSTISKQVLGAEMRSL